MTHDVCRILIIITIIRRKITKAMLLKGAAENSVFFLRFFKDALKYASRRYARHCYVILVSSKLFIVNNETCIGTRFQDMT